MKHRIDVYSVSLKKWVEFFIYVPISPNIKDIISVNINRKNEITKLGLTSSFYLVKYKLICEEGNMIILKCKEVHGKDISNINKDLSKQ